MESGNTTYDSRDGCNAIIEKQTNKLVAGCKNSTIPATVTSIGYGAFSDCEDLESVTIYALAGTLGANKAYLTYTAPAGAPTRGFFGTP